MENYLILKNGASNSASRHGLQGFIVKNIEGDSLEANDLSHIL